MLSPAVCRSPIHDPRPAARRARRRPRRRSCPRRSPRRRAHRRHLGVPPVPGRPSSPRSPRGRAGRCWPSPPRPGRPRTSSRPSAASSTATGSADFPAWETLPHERLSPRSDTVGKRLAVLRRLAPPRSRRPHLRPARRRRRPGPRRAPAGRRRAWATCARWPCAPATRHPWSRSSRTSRPRPTPAPTWSSAAASSPCAAASSTSSRPPRTTRCASSSGATRSRRSAGSRSPTSAASRSPSTACGPRRAASCCSPTSVRARAAALAGPAARRGRPARASSPRASRSRAWSRSPRPSSTAWRASSTPCATAPPWSLCDPERVRTRAHDLVATSQEFLEAGWANAAGGNAVPIDLQGVLGTASFWSLADLRAHAARARGCRGGTSARSSPTRSCRRRRVVVNTGLEEAPRYRGNTPEAVADLQRWVARRLARRRRHRGPGPGRARRRGARRRDRRRPARRRPSATSATGVVHLTTGSRRLAGSSRPASGSRCSPRPTSPARPGRAARPRTCARCRRGGATRSTRSSCKPGDFVVHEQHGVGKFVEMVQRTVGGATREYLVIEYAPSKRGQPGDRLYVPTDQLDQVTRYVGGEQPHAEQDGRLRLARRPSAKAAPLRQADRRRADPALQRPDGDRRATRSRRTPRGSASSRTRSPTSRRPTSSARSTRSRPTWSARCRWTG